MRIRMAENFRAVFYAPFYAAIALGFHAREGIDIEFVPSASPGLGTAGLLDGSIDVTWGGPMRVMKARDDPSGPPLVAFCEVVRRDPFYLVGKRQSHPFTLRDLATLHLGSVSEVPTPWLCLQHDLREVGIDPASIRRTRDRSMADNLGALQAGEIDVVQVFEPWASIAERDGIGQILHAASARGETAYTTFLATRSGVAANQDAFQRLVRALSALQAWLGQHDGAELAEVVADHYPTVERAILSTALSRYKAAHLWASDPGVSRQGFARLGQSLRSGGFITRIPAYEDCVADPASGPA